MNSVAVLFQGNKGNRSDCAHCKPAAEQITVAHTKQQGGTMRTGNTKSIFIKGPKMKASSGGCRSRTEAATSQLSVLRKRLTQRHGRLSEPERQREERFLSREPCGKIKPEDSEHSLTDALEKPSQHW